MDPVQELQRVLHLRGIGYALSLQHLLPVRLDCRLILIQAKRTQAVISGPCALHYHLAAHVVWSDPSLVLRCSSAEKCEHERKEQAKGTIFHEVFLRSFLGGAPLCAHLTSCGGQKVG